MLGGHGAFCFGIWEDSSLTEENNFRTERGFIAPNFSPRTNVALSELCITQFDFQSADRCNKNTREPTLQSVLRLQSERGSSVLEAKNSSYD